MLPRKLLWSEKAKEDVAELVRRRKDKAAVLDCIESNLLAVATNPDITAFVPGPLHERIFRFQCMDGRTNVFLVAVFAYAPDESIGLVRLTGQEF